MCITKENLKNALEFAAEHLLHDGDICPYIECGWECKELKESGKLCKIDIRRYEKKAVRCWIDFWLKKGRENHKL